MGENISFAKCFCQKNVFAFLKVLNRILVVVGPPQVE